MDQGLLEKKYLSFKKGVEDALRKFTSDIGDNVRGMREEINQMKQDIKKKSQLECNKCKDKFLKIESFEQIKSKVYSLEKCLSTELRNEINDLKIEVTKRNIDSEKVYPSDKFDIEMEIENMRKEKLKNENDIRDINRRIQSLQDENENIRKILENTKEANLQKTKMSHKCPYCELRCRNGYELENHIVCNHNRDKNYECNKCKAKFLSNWGLRRHMNVHQNLLIRKCHYFNDDLTCPFEKDGYKFAHIEADIYIFGTNCQMTKC